MSSDNPDMLIAARKGSPLVIGIGKDEFFMASDATPIIEYTKDVVYLNDLEIAVIDEGQLRIKTIEDAPATPYIQKLDMELGG
jgi:glucosamine--fructose-6-phosphate aminotransferase (isomerizing)